MESGGWWWELRKDWNLLSTWWEDSRDSTYGGGLGGGCLRWVNLTQSYRLLNSGPLLRVWQEKLVMGAASSRVSGSSDSCWCHAWGQFVHGFGGGGVQVSRWVGPWCLLCSFLVELGELARGTLRLAWKFRTRIDQTLVERRNRRRRGRRRRCFFSNWSKRKLEKWEIKGPHCCCCCHHRRQLVLGAICRNIVKFLRSRRCWKRIEGRDIAQVSHRHETLFDAVGVCNFTFLKQSHLYPDDDVEHDAVNYWWRCLNYVSLIVPT